jgi:hypothetical protein
MDMKSLLGGKAPNQAFAAKPLVQKWQRTGLLEGLRSETEMAGMAQLLENQARQLVKEASQTGTAEGSEEWAGVALPLVRRIFAEFAAKEFVSVQPMNLPSGLVFYLDFKYGTARPGFNQDVDPNPAGHPFASPGANDSLFGVTNADEASQGLYGAGRFGYSIKNVTGVAATVSAGASTGSGATHAAVPSASVNFDSAYTNNSANWFVLTVPVPTNADLFAVRSFTLVSGSTEIVPEQAFSVINTNYTASFVVTASLAANIQQAKGANALNVNYSVQPTDITRGDFEDANPFKGSGAGTGIDDGTDIDIPEVNLEMQSEPIVAKTRKLKAVWTPEFAQDLNAYHSIDAEAELTSMLSEYVSMEIDLEILDMLIAAAPTTEYWSAVNNEIWNGTNFTQTSTVTGGFYNTQGGWFQTLGTKLQKVSNKIHQKTLRGGANFLVTSPAVATILESIPGFAADTDGTKLEFAAGVQKIGAINNRYTVYKNPYMKENIILMGFRGAQFLETGAVFSPYVPLIMTPLVYDPVNFTPRKGVMTRYAKKVVRPEFYGKVYVKGLETL